MVDCMIREGKTFSQIDVCLVFYQEFVVMSQFYGKHLGHARFDTNSAPPTNAECKDPRHRTNVY